MKSEPKQIDFSQDDKSLITSEVNDLIEKGAISPSFHEPNEFISNIFLVQKKNGKFRPVIHFEKIK